MRRFVQILLFLLWVDESQSLYAKYMFAPFHWVGDFVVEPIAKVRPIDLMMLVVLALAVTKGAFKVRTVRPLKRTMLFAIGATVLAFLYGMVTGGDLRAAGWQAYLPISMILAAFAIAATHTKSEHFVGIIKAFVAAAVVHACVEIVFHFLYVRTNAVQPTPEYEAKHDDTVLWTSSIALLVLFALQFPSWRNRAIAGVLVPLIFVAMEFNKRRLADVSLIGALTVMYFLLPKSRPKRRIQRALLAAIPVAILYVAIGWSHPEGIFKPLRTFQTVSVDQDKSTKARNQENLGLIATASQYGWVMGSGWGHKYVEISSLYEIYVFELWPYVPHNSILGLFAYTGYLGFIGYWMIFPVSVFLQTRVARFAPRPLDRYVATVGAMQLVTCADQWYGDMGSFSLITMYTVASATAIALRLPLTTGVWVDGKAARLQRTPAPPRVGQV